MERKPRPTYTIKFLCSYGGKILPRATDGELRYAGGHTRVLAADPSMSFSELMVRLSELCGSSVTLRCPLPNGNLETLISITSDEDLANMIEEYDRASSSLTHPLKIRAILTPPKKLSPPPSSSSTTTTHSSSGSLHSSAESPLYSAARQNCSPAGYPIAVSYGSVKGCWYPRQLEAQDSFIVGLTPLITVTDAKSYRL